ncbi:MAG: DUF484 family protein [Maricaulaceae bacterium]|nr:DUF484 family protein [Maricaulaceae bacterium]
MGLAKRERTTHAGIDASAIRAAVMADPALITGDAELLARLAGDASDGNIVDLGARARMALCSENQRLKSEMREFAAAARANLAVQAQAHMAVLAVMEVESLAALDRALSGRIAGALGVDAARVFIEGQAQPANARAVLAAAPGMAEKLLGEGAEYVGEAAPATAAALYGPQGPRIASHALVRLYVRGREGVLALGARDAHAFQPGQGTELLNFLARAIERRIAAWIDPA